MRSLYDALASIETPHKRRWLEGDEDKLDGELSAAWTRCGVGMEVAWAVASAASQLRAEMSHVPAGTADSDALMRRSGTRLF